MNIELEIKAGSDQQMIDVTKWLFPIPLDKDGEPEFTDEEWINEGWRRHIVAQEKRYRAYTAGKTASSAETPDDSLVTKKAQVVTP